MYSSLYSFEMMIDRKNCSHRLFVETFSPNRTIRIAELSSADESRENWQPKCPLGRGNEYASDKLSRLGDHYAIVLFFNDVVFRCLLLNAGNDFQTWHFNKWICCNRDETFEFSTKLPIFAENWKIFLSMESENYFMGIKKFSLRFKIFRDKFSALVIYHFTTLLIIKY